MENRIFGVEGVSPRQLETLAYALNPETAFVNARAFLRFCRLQQIDWGKLSQDAQIRILREVELLALLRSKL